MAGTDNDKSAPWRGTIQHPVRGTWPRMVAVLSPGSQSPLPLIEYRMEGKGWQKFDFSGHCEQGFVTGELARTVRRSFSIRDFTGELILNDQPLGLLVSNTALKQDEVAGISSAQGTFPLTLKRELPELEASDLILDAGEFGPIAKIFGVPKAKFSGSVNYGQFLDGAAKLNGLAELRSASCCLLAIYFSLIQPMVSTEPAG